MSKCSSLLAAFSALDFFEASGLASGAGTCSGLASGAVCTAGLDFCSLLFGAAEVFDESGCWAEGGRKEITARTTAANERMLAPDVERGESRHEIKPAAL